MLGVVGAGVLVVGRRSTKEARRRLVCAVLRRAARSVEGASENPVASGALGAPGVRFHDAKSGGIAATKARHRAPLVVGSDLLALLAHILHRLCFARRRISRRPTLVSQLRTALGQPHSIRSARLTRCAFSLQLAASAAHACSRRPPPPPPPSSSISTRLRFAERSPLAWLACARRCALRGGLPGTAVALTPRSPAHSNLRATTPHNCPRLSRLACHAGSIPASSHSRWVTMLDIATLVACIVCKARATCRGAQSQARWRSLMALQRSV